MQTVDSPSIEVALAAILAKLPADPATSAILANMEADIALMKADLAAIRVILES